MCLADKIRGCDQLGVPVSLNLRGQSVHKTILGGCCSLFATLFLLFLMTAQLVSVFNRNNYDQSVNDSYLWVDPFSLDDVQTISTDDVIPAL